MSYLNASVVVFHYKEALYQVFAPLPLLNLTVCETCGVPAGLNSGPLLFLLYINDLNSISISNILAFIMFADDTNTFIKGKKLDDVTASVNNELMKVNSWFYANLLSLNVKKTNYILFGNKQIPDIDIYSLIVKRL